MPTVPGQHQQPTTLTGTQACKAAHSFTVPCYPHSLFWIPAPHMPNNELSAIHTLNLPHLLL